MTGRVDPQSTCWIVIREAADGRPDARAEFAARYEEIIRTYLGHRWRRSGYREHLDDAVQEVFVECFREGGVLERVDAERPGGFRAFFYGVMLNVARRFETRTGRRREVVADPDLPERLESDEATLSRVFDRAWLDATLKQAARVMEDRAKLAGEPAIRRVALLRSRFHEDRSIAEIAAEWKVPAEVIYREGALARDEFKTALRDVVATYHAGPPGAIERECAALLSLLE